MLNAHTDTVGVAGMTDPFEPRIEGGRLYGRGAQDMKGSLAACMLATAERRERTAARRRDPHRRLRRGGRERRDGGGRGVACRRTPRSSPSRRTCRSRSRTAASCTSRSRRSDVQRTARGPTRHRRDREDGPRSSSGSRSSTVAFAPTRRTGSSGAGASTLRSSRVGRSTRAIRRAASCRPSGGRSRARRVELAVAEIQELLDGAAAADPDFHGGRARRSPRASRSRSPRTRRSSAPSAGCAARGDSEPSRTWSASRSGRTQRSSPTRGFRRCSSARCGAGLHTEVEWVDVGVARAVRRDLLRRRGGASAASARGTSATAADVSSRASQRTVCPPGTTDDLEQVAERLAMGVEQVVVREVGALAEHEEGRDVDVLEAEAVETPSPRTRPRPRTGSSGSGARPSSPARRAARGPRRRASRARDVELALVEAAVDQLVEGDVGLLLPGVLGGREGDVGRKQDRGIEEDELRDELRRARGELECEPAAEGVADEVRGSRARPSRRSASHRCARCPTAAPTARAVAEQIRREDVVVRELCGERGEVAAVVADAVQADDARGVPARPTRGARASRRVCVQRASESGTSSVRRSSRSLTSDQIDDSVLVDEERPAVGRVRSPRRRRRTPSRPRRGARSRTRRCTRRRAPSSRPGARGHGVARDEARLSVPASRKDSRFS